ncbi:DUF3231 family protein [Clostridium sp. A1-XYC3]|uniref:DUF3231 family protein n=1 Tax=Clostridium tanneri TaxID=3037988 RepID=A0ABU4JUN7_9CLOT|nr:DUF3231 family protein [Clostridium sp. A1-XYC3]MDW8801870.1 DUF3231 family protein [Clostridium sp. A1-XYC3]
MNTSHDIENIRLTAAEIGELWSTYMNNSASKCLLSYFINKVKDPNISELVEFSLDLSETHLKVIEDIFKTVNHPIPQGFNEKDFNINGEKLFSDSFMLQYIKYLSRFSLYNYSEALTVSSREDVRKFFTDSIQSAVELSNKNDDVLLSKGLYIRSPYLNVPEEVSFVSKKSYIQDLFGDKRPLNSLEITQVFINMQTNILGKAFAMGLSQTIKDRKIKDYIIRGKEIAEKHIDVFSDLLKESDLPSPMTFDAEITKATDPIFSDKLVMFHFIGLTAFGVASYGNALSKSMRADVSATFTRLAAEIAKYAKDGIDIMIDNEWLEEVPNAIDRKKLIEV